jgi:hypothetical protein
MYSGPVIDPFLHAPWIGRFDGAVTRADVVPWTDDARLRRVMHTFHHLDERGEKKPPQVSLETVVGQMDQAGVAGGVLIAKVYYPATVEQVRALHEELADLSRRSSGRLKWVASVVPPQHGSGSYWDLMQNPRIIAALADTPGLVGVHITPSPWSLAPNDRWYYPLYAKCAELRLPLFAYVGMPGPLWPMEPNNPAHLEDVALAFPEMPIIAHHIGDPWTEVAIRLAAHLPNYYLCTSAWSPKAYPKALLDFMGGRWHGVRGCDRVIFASDYPLLDLQKTVAAARGLGLEEAQLKRILHDNAYELFFKDRS